MKTILLYPSMESMSHLQGSSLDEMVACWQRCLEPQPLWSHLSPGMWSQAIAEHRMLVTHAVAGWSALASLYELEARLRACTTENRLLRKAKVVLRRMELWQVHRSGIPLVELTERGQRVLAQTGIPVVESEVERLRRLHDGDRQPRHTALVCHFTHYARLNGHRTTVCPELSGDSGVVPDVCIEKDGERIYVEVQGRNVGERWRRHRKWSNFYRFQGFVAIAATTPYQAHRLAQEAQVAGAVHGVATDLQSLRRAARALWTHCWRSRHGDLQPVPDPTLTVQELLYG